ncbi:recombinase family protein, partial [Rhodopseudomonas parapalustris]
KNSGAGQFGRIMRENIANGEIPFRKAYLRAVIDRIEVDDHTVRIVGDSATLEQVIAGKSVPAAGIRSFVRKWRTRHDSNV